MSSNLDNFFDLDDDDNTDNNDSHKLVVAYGVLGSSIRLKKRDERFSGQMEYAKFLSFLTHQENIEKVIILSRNDLNDLSLEEKTKIDPFNKIISINDSIDMRFSRIEIIDTESKEIVEQKLLAQFESIKTTKKNFAYVLDRYKIDVGYFFMSQGAYTASVFPGYLRTKTDPNRPAKVLTMCQRYASHIIDIINTYNFPWFLLATDPRYVKSTCMYPREISNLPQEILGQFNERVRWDHIEEYSQESRPKTIDTYVDHKYSGIEMVNIMEESVTPPKTEKPIKFTIVSRQVENAPPKGNFRYQELKKWILDNDNDQSAVIFGDWKKEFTEGYPQFKGFINTDELNEIFKKTRYTLILPTKAGWATSKPWEMLVLGVLPFFHSHFDIQNNMIPAKSFLRCKSPTDFYDKMEQLDADETLRITILDDLQKKYITNNLHGQFLIDLINDRHTHYGIEKTL